MPANSCFERKARLQRDRTALRKSSQHNLVAGNAARDFAFDQRIDEALNLTPGHQGLRSISINSMSYQPGITPPLLMLIGRRAWCRER